MHERVHWVLWIVSTQHVSYYTDFVTSGEQGQRTLDRLLSMYLFSDHLIPDCILTSFFCSVTAFDRRVRGLTVTARVCESTLLLQVA